MANIGISSPLAKVEVDPFHHSMDSDYFEAFDTFDTKLHLPEGFTKYIVLQLVAAIIILLIYIPIARRARQGDVPTGKFWNFAEFLLTFIRDQVAKPALHKDADKFVPFLWTLFLFILVCNLLGMIPFLGTPTASLAVTGVLALIAFFLINGFGIAVNGVKGYAKSFVPHVEMDTPLMKIMGPFLLVGLTMMEVLSMFIRCTVLAIRLFATMFAGHTVLFILLLFIRLIGIAAVEGTDAYSPAAPYLFWPITGFSVIMLVALSVLELFIAALQAFVFTFLTAVFLGMAMHPQH